MFKNGGFAFVLKKMWKILITVWNKVRLNFNIQLQIKLRGYIHIILKKKVFALQQIFFLESEHVSTHSQILNCDIYSNHEIKPTLNGDLFLYTTIYSMNVIKDSV